MSKERLLSEIMECPHSFHLVAKSTLLIRNEIMAWTEWGPLVVCIVCSPTIIDKVDGIKRIYLLMELLMIVS